MELPVSQPGKTTTRGERDILAMAIAVQANLVQLRVAHAKQLGPVPDDHLLRVPSPGAVRAFRETLIDRHVLRDYAEFELRARLHEVWGQYCLIAWLFQQDPSQGTVNFAAMPADAKLRCDAEIEIKHTEVHAFLWRLRFEQRRRQDAEYAKSPALSHNNLLAAKIPAVVFGKTADDATEDELLAGACQHAGMLAVLRWTMDSAKPWADPGIMDVNDTPF